MEFMFSECFSLISIDISHLNIKNVESRNTFKSDLYEDKNESGKFGASESNFKELLKKLIEDKKTIQKSKNMNNTNNFRNISIIKK